MRESQEFLSDLPLLGAILDRPEGFAAVFGRIIRWKANGDGFSMSSSRGSFNELFLRHQRDVFAFILTLVPDRNDAADVFQQTCLALLEKKAEYELGREFFPWACGFALNETRRFRRNHIRERSQLDDAAIEAVANVQFRSAQKINVKLDRLEQCLAALPDDKREMLMQCYSYHGGMKDLAEALDVDPNALYKRLERIRKTLVECMEKTK
jgi:RNA polymerase sigma-70 factor, ECF subfamily